MMRNGRLPGLLARFRTRLPTGSYCGLVSLAGKCRRWSRTVAALLSLRSLGPHLRAIRTLLAVSAIETIAAIRALSTITSVASVTPITSVAVMALITVTPVPALEAIPTLLTIAASLTVLEAVLLPVAIPIILPRPIVARPAIFETLAFVTRRVMGRLRHGLAAGTILSLFVRKLVAHHSGFAKPSRTMPRHTCVRISTALSDLLLAKRHDDAIIMLCVLQVVLREHRVAARLRVPGEGHIFFSDMSRRSAQLDVRPRAFEAARQRILALAALIAAIAIIAPASSAVLLSLPHGLHSQ